MSKYVKGLQMGSLKRQLEGVGDLLVVNVVGMNCKQSHDLRMALRKKNIHLEVVQNNLARKVLGGMGLPKLDDAFQGPTAVVWGGAGIIELAREITDFAKKLEKLQLKGGCISGEPFFGKEGVEMISRLPSKPEVLGQLVALFTSPGAQVIALATSPAAQLVSQIKQLAEKEETAPATIAAG